MGPSIEQWTKAIGGPTSGFDYLRIILASSVLVWHAFALTAGADASAQFMTGWLGAIVRLVLPAFFALSGFLVASSFARNSLSTFLIFRGLRIAPALAVEITLSAFVLGSMLTTEPLSAYFSDHLFARYFLNLVGDIQYVLPGLFEHNPIPRTVNGSLWTVPYELECYIALVVFAIIGIMGRPKVLCFLVLAGGGLVLTVSLLREVPILLMDNAVPGRVLVLCFFAGAMLYAAREFVPYSDGLFAGSLFAALAFLSTPWLYVFSPIPAAYVTVWLGLKNPRKLPIILSGDYSYGIYLYAFPIQQALVQFFPQSGFFVILPLSLASVSLFAAFSWHAIERPTLKLKRFFKTAKPNNGETVYMTTAINFIMNRQTPADISRWHPWTTGLRPVRSIDGSITFGNVRRRFHGGQWEFSQRDETIEEHDARQW